MLSERYSVPVLICILKNDGKVKFSELRHIINNYPTLEKLMLALEKSGLVKLSRVTRPYKTNYAELTDLGFRVSNKLSVAEDILSGVVPEVETNCSTPAEGGHPLN